MNIVIEADPGADGMTRANTLANVFSFAIDAKQDTITVVQPNKGRDQTPTPTRVSCDKNDPGYSAFRAAKADGFDVFVYLDGVEQKEAIVGDSAEGLVIRNMLSPDGNIVFDGGTIATETVRGRVTIELRSR